MSKESKHQSFDNIWLEVILTKGVLKREDMLFLVDKFGIEFFQKNWRARLPLEEIRIVLLFDTSPKELVPLVQEILSKKYPYSLQYQECKKIYNFLKRLDINLLRKLGISIAPNKKLKELLKENWYFQEINKEDLLFWLMESLYK